MLKIHAKINAQSEMQINLPVIVKYSSDARDFVEEYEDVRRL